MDSIGERIRFARKKNNLTIPALSKLTGLSPGNISDLENNKSMPSSNALIKLKNALNVSIDWLLTGEMPLEVKESEGKYSVDKEDDLLIKAIKELPEERRKDIEGYVKVCLKTVDLEKYFEEKN